MQKTQSHLDEEIAKRPFTEFAKALNTDDLYDPSIRKQVKIFGELLKVLRQRNKLTLRDVQRLVGISNSFLSQIESGDRGFPTLKVLEKLGSAYGTTAVGLLQVYEMTKKEVALETNPDEKFVNDGFRQLPPIDRQMFVSWLRFRLNELREETIKNRTDADRKK